MAHWYATNPKTLLISIGVVVLLTLWGSRLHTLIEDRMLAAWRNVDPPRSAAMTVIDRFVRSLRTAGWYRAAHRFAVQTGARLFCNFYSRCLRGNR